MSQPKQVDPDVWRACAGNSIQIPPLHSRVYYFPQGHLEQIARDSPPPPHVTTTTTPPFIPCHVTKLSFLSNPTTDEVFTRITLSPKLHSLSSNPSPPAPQNVVVSFAKVLTPSDANNGGGFSVPRFCADSIFPPLDYNADPPVQNIKITDVQGHTWEFRHIYRGTPRRHLLTTGWSKFVNSKKLIAGDSVVFMRNKLTNVLYVGVRRAVRNVDLERERSAYAAYAHLVVRKEKDEKEKEREEEVVRAVERATRGEEFEVLYYPKGVAMNGSAEFVVAAEKVEGAMRVFWRPQMRVKIAMETEDSSRMTWFQGTVSGVVVVESGAWRGTTWRMLEVAWDEPEILQNMKRVSPWQVEVVSSTPPIHAAFPPAKKLRGLNPGLLADEDGDIPLPSFGFHSSMMGQLSPSSLSYNTFPAGMQGARQNPFIGSTLTTTVMGDGARQRPPDNHVDNMSQRVDAVSTDLNIRSVSSDTPSPDSQNSVQFFSRDSAGKQSCDVITTKASITSFQLFGKMIHTEQPLKSIDDMSSTEYEDSTTDGTGDTQDHSLSDPCDRPDAHCQRSPIDEAM